MNDKILLTYATKRGATSSVAQAIAETLQQRGKTVDVVPIQKNPDPSVYSAVMVGSAIRIGAWLPEAVDYVRSHQAVLQGKTTAFFLVCLTLKDNTPENQQIVQAYLDPVRALVKPQQEGFFAGMFFFKEHSLLERLLGRVIKIPEGDYRNWDTIRAWAEQVF